MLLKLLLGILIGSVIVGLIAISIFFLLFVFYYGDEEMGDDVPI